MEKITFADIAAALKTGREIEFSYNQKKYSITNSNGSWILCCDTDTPALMQTICTRTERELLPDKVKAVLIDGVSIPSIFDNGQYEENSVYIL